MWHAQGGVFNRDSIRSTAVAYDDHQLLDDMAPRALGQGLTTGRGEVTAVDWDRMSDHIDAAIMRGVMRSAVQNNTVRPHDAFQYYSTASYWMMHTEGEMTVASQQPTPEPPRLASLQERYNNVLRRADRCAQQGDNFGRAQALNMAQRLRREILSLSTTTNSI
jgi:hypothetical protein